MNTIPLAVSSAVVEILAKDRLRTAEAARRAASLNGRAAGRDRRPRHAWFHRSTAPVAGA
jgi:hypothetical protein